MKFGAFCPKPMNITIDCTLLVELKMRKVDVYALVFASKKKP